MLTDRYLALQMKGNQLYRTIFKICRAQQEKCTLTFGKEYVVTTMQTPAKPLMIQADGKNLYLWELLF